MILNFLCDFKNQFFEKLILPLLILSNHTSTFV